MIFWQSEYSYRNYPFMKMPSDQGVLSEIWFILNQHSEKLHCSCLWWFASCLFLSLWVSAHSVTLRALFQMLYRPENVTSDVLRCRSGYRTPSSAPPHAQSHSTCPRVHANNFSHINPLPWRNTNRVIEQHALACTLLIKTSAQRAGWQFIEPNDAF